MSTVPASGSYWMELQYLTSKGIGPESWKPAFVFWGSRTRDLLEGLFWRCGNKHPLDGDRTQNAHRICTQSGICGLCGSWNQQLADNKARGMVQLRPWPPTFSVTYASCSPPVCVQLRPIQLTIPPALVAQLAAILS